MRRGAVALLALAAWIAGSTLGTIRPGSHLSAAHAAPFIEIGQAHAGYVPVLDGTTPIFILFIGSGARPGEDVAHSLADSIHIVAISPAKHHASILGIPRDSWVSIPGYGMNKINAAMVYGGPPLLVQTVEQITGIKLEYWALATFWGFTDIVNSIGGLNVDVPFPMHDHYSHAEFDAGVQVLRGPQALAFARDRHSLPEGDFGRSEDGGRLIVAALAQFRREFTKDPGQLLTWVAAGMRNVQCDIPLDEVLNLAFTVSQINPKTVQNMVAPGGTGAVGGISTVNLLSSDSLIFDDLKNDGLVSKNHVPPSPNASLLGG